jgi:hypothetical protein
MQCDIAMLTVDDEEFWTGDVKALELGPLPAMQESVTVVGYPQGEQKRVVPGDCSPAYAFKTLKQLVVLACRWRQRVCDQGRCVQVGQAAVQSWPHKFADVAD